MSKWEKEHQVKVRRIKQQVIKHVDGVESIHIIVENGFVLAVDSVELQN